MSDEVAAILRADAELIESAYPGLDKLADWRTLLGAPATEIDRVRTQADAVTSGLRDHATKLDDNKPTPPPPPPPAGHGRDVTPATTGIAALGLTEADLDPVGNLATSRHGQTIEGLLVRGTIRVGHDDVTIRGCRQQSPAGVYAVTYTDPFNAATWRRGLILDSCDIFGDTHRIGLLNLAGSLQRRLRIEGFGTGQHIHRDTTIEDTWVDRLHYTPGSHNTSMSINGGVSNTTLRRVHFRDGNSAAFSIYGTYGPNTHIDVLDSFFDTPRAHYQVQAGYDTSKPGAAGSHHIRFVGNMFGDRGGSYPAVVTVWDGSKPGNEWRDNRRVDGSPV